MAFLLLETWFGSRLFDQIAFNGSALKTFDNVSLKLSVLEGSGSWRDQLSGPRTLLGEAPACTSIKFSECKHKMTKTWK